MEEFVSAYPLLVPALALVFWFMLMALMSRLSGWAALAEVYPAFESYDGAARRFSSISMERLKGLPTNYNGVVTLGADVRGLHLRILLPFRPYHPDLVIPWSDVAASKKRFLLAEGVELQFARAPGVRLAMPRALAEWAAAHSLEAMRLV